MYEKTEKPRLANRKSMSNVRSRMKEPLQLFDLTKSNITEFNPRKIDHLKEINTPFGNKPMPTPLQLATRLKWNNEGHFISGNQTSPEKIVQILNDLLDKNVITKVNVTNLFKNGHIVAANFGGAQDHSNLVSWGDQMENKQGDFEKTIMNGGSNSSESSWQSYPSGGISEEGDLTDNVAVSNGALDSTVKAAWVDNVTDIVKQKTDDKFEKLGSSTLDNRPSDQKIKESVTEKYDLKIKNKFDIAVSRLPNSYQLEYKPDSSKNPNNRPKIEYKLTSYPSITYNRNAESYNYLKPLFVSDNAQRWKVKD